MYFCPWLFIHFLLAFLLACWGRPTSQGTRAQQCQLGQALSENGACGPPSELGEPPAPKNTPPKPQPYKHLGRLHSGLRSTKTVAQRHEWPSNTHQRTTQQQRKTIHRKSLLRVGYPVRGLRKPRKKQRCWHELPHPLYTAVKVLNCAYRKECDGSSC